MITHEESFCSSYMLFIFIINGIIYSILFENVCYTLLFSSTIYVNNIRYCCVLHFVFVLIFVYFSVLQYIVTAAFPPSIPSSSFPFSPTPSSSKEQGSQRHQLNIAQQDTLRPGKNTY